MCSTEPNSQVSIIRGPRHALRLPHTHGHAKTIPHELMLIPQALGKLSVYNHKPTIHLKPRKTTKKKDKQKLLTTSKLNQAHDTYGCLPSQTSNKTESYHASITENKLRLPKLMTLSPCILGQCKQNKKQNHKQASPCTHSHAKLSGKTS